MHPLTAVVVAVIAACGPSEPPMQTASVAAQAAPLLDSTSRIRNDAARHRVWSLTQAGLALRDVATAESRVVALPNWHWAHVDYGGCLPDVALGPRGEVVVTSNVIPTLWRVDPQTLQVTEHRLSLNADHDKDVGFTGLVYSAQDDAYFAVSAAHGTLWRIDPLLRKAQKVVLAEPLRGACAVELRADVRRTARMARLCVRSAGEAWHVVIAPDQRSAYLRGDRCAVGAAATSVASASPGRGMDIPN
ncbi:MAG: hypothetical protein ABR570_10990 [Burkholderiales bacterium]